MKNKSALKWVIWTLAAFFYFYEYLLRVSPSVMVPELMQAFSVDAAQMGILSAFYFYAYAPMQLPVGMLMDRFGARKLLTFASLICGLGAIFFGIAHSILLAKAGRLFIGVGSSFAFVAMVFVCSHWFKPEKRAFLVGLANSIGMLGAVAGQGPLSLMVKNFDWRYTMNILGVLGLALAVLIFILIRGKSSTPVKQFESSPDAPIKLMEGFKAVTKNGFCWLNAIIALLFYMTTTAIGGLWGVPFLQAAYGVSKHTASFAMSMLFVGWLVGGPLVGVLSDRMGKRKPLLGLSIIFTLLSLLPIIYLTDMPITIVYGLFFFVGFFSSGELLNFTFSTELVNVKYKGAAIAFTNFIVAVGSSFIQPLIGYFLDMGATTSKSTMVHHYSAFDYKMSFSILPAMLVLAIILSFFLKEKKRAGVEDVPPLD